MSDFNVILSELPGLGRVRVCDCNSIHISVGPVTLNLSPEAFAETASMLNEAMRRYSKLMDAQVANGPSAFPTSKVSLVTH